LRQAENRKFGVVVHNPEEFVISPEESMGYPEDFMIRPEESMGHPEEFMGYPHL
jgi:hypothetical protein